ncbi:MAG: hypothetical protein K5647_08705 [Clostridiales bacterium]|nr:hypothetical protein [Clostridiales bacterium]
MKTIDEIIKILDSAGRVNVHVHTHLCDGAADMTAGKPLQVPIFFVFCLKKHHIIEHFRAKTAG